ncbi:MAG: molybdate ABC transporter substrate-binding protein [Deltaproteobacteria bacterium]|nr:molybdate ABC transporter substrate-binding protein [Deltaproteobacteria bacterium]
MRQPDMKNIESRLPRRTIFMACAIVMACLSPLAADAENLTVAAAADLTFAFREVGAQFQQQSTDQLRISYGSSGNFFSQIKNGAPYDVFFSADVQYPQKLAAAGLIEPGTIYEYAAGKIVIWVPAGSKLDLSRGLNVLLDPGVHKIAIANPEHAPYGRAAVAALQHDSIYDKVKGKVVMGEDISQTAQFVQSGNADAGILALSLALGPPMRERGRFVIIPPDTYPPIIQAACVIKATKHLELAKRFLEFMKQPATVATMEKYGFVLPTTVADPGHQK